LAITGTGNKGFIPEKEPEKWLLRLRMAAGAKITHCNYRGSQET